MKLKEIGTGADSLEKLRLKNAYYVDKTDFIQTVFSSASEVLLLTRPRRFGKTLTMHTFESFLSINPDNPGDVSKQLKLFEGTHILSDEGTPEEVAARKKFVNDFMGKYPVICFSLKEVDGLDFKGAYVKFAAIVRQLASEFSYLKRSEKLEDEEKEGFRNLLKRGYLDDPDHQNDLQFSLKDLTMWLCAHHGVPPVVLIDEYDVPLAKAEAHGYYREMLDLLKTFLGALKTNDHMYKAVLTGCLRISKESIFTGINHFSVNSVFDRDDRYSSAIGFTKSETETMLDYYDLGEYKAQIREHYDGYRFGRTEIFCPWDVVSFCDEARTLKAQGQKPDLVNYWTNTSGNDIIDEFADYIRPEHIDDMQTLVDGGSICVKVREELNYPDMKLHDIDAFWTMLLFTGYLTVCAESSLNLKEPQLVRIPNLEIRECFCDRILEHFKSNPEAKSAGRTITKALLAGDRDAVENGLLDFLSTYISVRDLATRAPAENFYQGMMDGLVGGSGLTLDYASNQEAGAGFADIGFLSSDRRTAVVIELKQTRYDSEIDSLADDALTQIETKGYARKYDKSRRVSSILAFGIGFCRKNCSVSVKILKCPDAQKA